MRGCLAGVCMALCAGAAAAEPAAHALGLRAGTLGLALEYARPLTARLDVRAGYAVGRLRRGITEDDIDYDGEFRFDAPLLLFDFKPWAGRFRVTLGGYAGTPEIGLHTEGENERYRIGGATYVATGRLDGNADFGSAAPYLGVGWGGVADARGWSLSADVGVLFGGSPAVALQAQGRACDATLLPCSPDGFLGFDVNDPGDSRAQSFRAELERERRSLEEDAEALRYWPVLNLGLHYRF